MGTDLPGPLAFYPSLAILTSPPLHAVCKMTQIDRVRHCIMRLPLQYPVLPVPSFPDCLAFPKKQEARTNGCIRIDCRIRQSHDCMEIALFQSMLLPLGLYILTKQRAAGKNHSSPPTRLEKLDDPGEKEECQPGTLHHRSIRYGKPNGHCVRPDDPGQLSWQLVWSYHRESVCRGIPQTAFE